MADADSQLVARCAAGDMAALESLYRRYVERVWRYAWFRTHSRESAAEIVQETFLRVARSARGFEGRSTVATWLFAVTRSATIEHARREHRAAVPAEPGMLRLIPTRADPPDRPDGQTREAVREAVRKLPGPQRDAIVLYEFSGLRVREVADVLGWTEARVKTTLFRARRKLRDLLERHVTDDTGRQSNSM